MRLENCSAILPTIDLKAIVPFAPADQRHQNLLVSFFVFQHMLRETKRAAINLKNS